MRHIRLVTLILLMPLITLVAIANLALDRHNYSGKEK
jgi:hypothetical protein